jgi:arylsulfatase
MKPVEGKGTLILETGTRINRKTCNEGRTDRLVMENVFLPGMDTDLIPFYQVNGNRYFPLLLKVTRMD